MNPNDWDGDGNNNPELTPSSNIEENTTQTYGSGYLNISHSYPSFIYTNESETISLGQHDSGVSFRYGNITAGQRPIEFNFSTTNWKIVISLVLNIILFPILVLLSRLLKKPTGFKV